MFELIFTIIAPLISLGTVAALCLVLCAALMLSSYKKRREIALRDKNRWYRFPLVQKTKVTHNTNIYRFALDSNARLGLSAGQHIAVRADINGSMIQRNYTPISLDHQKGYFDLMIKTYPNGNISKYMDEMEIGDLLEVSGPKGRYRYVSNKRRQICMIAGGTGITPMLQVIRHILYHKKDNTIIRLIFANVTIQDILLKEELDSLVGKFPARLSVYYVVDALPTDMDIDKWKGGVGFVTADIIKKVFPPPGSNMQILLCGPPPMVKAVSGECVSLGYDPANPISNPEDMIFKF